MQLNDEDCIRYLMREMDPSEVIEFEREMLSNQDLLIEVESLRSTYNKVKKLPLKETPKEVLERVKALAVEEQKKKADQSFKLIGWFGKSVAAIACIILLVSSGIYFFTPDSAADKSPANLVQSATPVQPWVDRNEIITVTDRMDENRALLIGEEYEKSFEKLIPVNNSEEYRSPRQGVLLTRSSQN